MTAAAPWEEGWEGEEWSPIHPSIGWLPVESYRPGAWKPNWPNAAYHAMTPADGYWGAKLVGSFTDEQIRAAVGAGRLPAPAADTLTDILQYRRDRTVRYWYGRVTPVEKLSVEASPAGSDGELRLSFRDLGLTDGPWTGGETTYRWRFRHGALGVEATGTSGARRNAARQSLTVDAGWPAELPDTVQLSSEERLARLELRAVRPGADARRAVVWLTWGGPDQGYRVSGLRH